MVLRVFDNELEAGLTRQMLQNAGVTVFIVKDDAGGMEPHLQRTTGVRLVLPRRDAETALDILKAWETPA